MLVICLSEGVLQSQDRRGRSAVPAWFAGGIRLHKLHKLREKTKRRCMVFLMMIGYNEYKFI